MPNRSVESTLACALRGLSHERLATMAAALACALADIGNERADSALRNTAFEPVQDLAPSRRTLAAEMLKVGAL